MGMIGLLLIGHGSRLPYNKALVEDTARLIAKSDRSFIIKCAFMEKNTPSIKEALEEFRKEDIDSIVVAPLFLAKGVHILEDIPILLGLEGGSNKGTFQLNSRRIPLVYAEPVGNDPLLAELMMKNVKAAMRMYL
jgi:sirohydrochlorin cobaltochelatase